MRGQGASRSALHLASSACARLPRSAMPPLNRPRGPGGQNGRAMPMPILAVAMPILAVAVDSLFTIFRESGPTWLPRWQAMLVDYIGALFSEALMILCCWFLNTSTNSMFPLARERTPPVQRAPGSIRRPRPVALVGAHCPDDARCRFFSS